MRLTLIGILLALLLASGCAREGFTIRGTVIDSETGEEVSRAEMYLHFFCDEIDHQQSLDPRDVTDFEVTMPRATVRIRAADLSSRYHLFEKTIEIAGGEIEFDIPMVPTHYVLLKGKILDARTGTVILPKPGIGNTPLFYVQDERGFSAGLIGPASNGTYSVRVPREKLTFLVVDTPLSPRTKTLDLTGFDGEVRQFDLVLK